MQQIEVTPENIVKYNLVQLTGNSAEELMKAANEAFDAGYTLTCRIPDDLLHVNVFDVVGGTEVSDEMMKHWEEAENVIVEGQRGRREIRDPEGNLIGVQFIPDARSDVVQGEVVETHDDKE